MKQVPKRIQAQKVSVQFDSQVTVANRYSDNSSKQVKVTDTIVIK